MATVFYKIAPDYTEKWLDKALIIDGYTVDAFRLTDTYRHTAEITFLKWEVPTEYNFILACDLPERIKNNAFKKVIKKNKRITFIDGNMIISVNGLKYCIGKYEEVHNEQI